MAQTKVKNGQDVLLDAALVTNTGQALAAESLPVVLPALQVTALTPPAAITGFATQTTLASVLAKLIASPATEAKQDLAITGLASIDGRLAGQIAVTGVFYQATQPISAAALPLPTGAATETTLTAMSVKLPATLGIKTAAGSLSVAPAITGTPTSRASTITTGGSAQQLAAANTTRIGLMVQNNSSGDLRVSVTTAAGAAVGFKVQPGALLVVDQPYCGTGAVSIWGATTAQEFHALEATP